MGGNDFTYSEREGRDLSNDKGEDSESFSELRLERNCRTGSEVSLLTVMSSIQSEHTVFFTEMIRERKQSPCNNTSPLVNVSFEKCTNNKC